ncbi:MAG: hypothetical protein JST19_00845 [Bacteroidetes bacterium]|nr:hypothetical protein [Bacteroidota bacterium]
MKNILFVAILTGMVCPAFSQELYVNTEPASNMATNSVGVRLENQGYYNPEYKTRTTLEVMFGASKTLMIHGALYASDYYQHDQHFEGGGVYAKYRFLSIDSVQSHFRGAVFVKASAINNPMPNQEIGLEGDNSGFQTGVVFTRLIHKVAFSGTASCLHDYNNIGGYDIPATNARNAVGYTLSAGYLLLPRKYENYNQVNVNVYAELLGKSNPGYGQSYLDIAPAVQFIFDSFFRVDFSFRTPLYNDMVRTSANTYLVRLEYNLFNVFSKR